MAIPRIQALASKRALDLDFSRSSLVGRGVMSLSSFELLRPKSVTLVHMAEQTEVFAMQKAAASDCHLQASIQMSKVD